MAFDSGAEDDFINLNIDDISDTREAIPANTYVCEILGVVKKQKEGSAYPYLEVTMRPVLEPYTKKQLWLNLSFHPKALWNMKEFVPKCGVKWGKEGFKFGELVGKRIGVTVTVVPGFKDPNVPQNEVGTPYTQAA